MVAAVITGAAGDLGQALSEAFLADGYRVYGGDIAPGAPRAGLVPVRLDVTDRAAVFALAESADVEAGPLRLWINAAGILRVVKVSEADPLDWERIIAVNLTGTYHGCAAALEVMRRSGGGRIVNIGSLSGQVGGTALHPAYGASKAGVHALTRTYALEGARYGVYCNAVAPSVDRRRDGRPAERAPARAARPRQPPAAPGPHARGGGRRPLSGERGRELYQRRGAAGQRRLVSVLRSPR
jgi:NAD(P)-dependent dehydrogenase (short-subunit alcohol dehydrogenase family)